MSINLMSNNIKLPDTLEFNVQVSRKTTARLEALSSHIVMLRCL